MQDDPVAKREGKNRRSLRLKVERLETAVALGERFDWMQGIKNARDVALWIDEEAGLTKWTSPNVTAPNGHYPELAKRLRTILRAINSPGKGGSAATPTSGEAKQRERQLLDENRSLIRQNADLLRTVDIYREEVALLKSRLEIAQRRLPKSPASAIRG